MELSRYGVDVAADEIPRGGDLSLEIRMRPIDAGIDHGDTYVASGGTLDQAFDAAAPRAPLQTEIRIVGTRTRDSMNEYALSAGDAEIVAQPRDNGQPISALGKGEYRGGGVHRRHVPGGDHV